jgi:hypothetical protein
MCRLPFIRSLSASPPIIVLSQILWFETLQNDSSTSARWETLGIPLLFEARDLDSYRTRTHAT